MPFKHKWESHDKRGSGDQRYAKYDSVLAVIVGKPTNDKGKVSAIYLSKAAMDLLGDPEYIEILKDGDTYVGFRATIKEDPKGFVVNRPMKKDEKGNVVAAGRPFLSARSAVTKYQLRPGAYTAENEINGAEVVIFFNRLKPPSDI